MTPPSRRGPGGIDRQLDTPTKFYSVARLVDDGSPLQDCEPPPRGAQKFRPVIKRDRMTKEASRNGAASVKDPAAG